MVVDKESTYSHHTDINNVDFMRQDPLVVQEV